MASTRRTGQWAGLDRPPRRQEALARGRPPRFDRVIRRSVASHRGSTMYLAGRGQTAFKLRRAMWQCGVTSGAAGGQERCSSSPPALRHSHLRHGPGLARLGQALPRDQLHQRRRDQVAFRVTKITGWPGARAAPGRAGRDGWPSESPQSRTRTTRRGGGPQRHATPGNNGARRGIENKDPNGTARQGLNSRSPLQTPIDAGLAVDPARTGQLDPAPQAPTQ